MQQLLLGQIEGAGKAIDSAVQSGWPAVVVVLIMLSFLGSLGITLRWLINSMSERLTESTKREDRTAAQIADLQKTIDTTIMDLLTECTKALAKNSQATEILIATLSKRICLLEYDHQVKVVDAIASVVSEKVLSTILPKVKP